MDFNLKVLNVKKEPFTVNLYATTLAQLRKVAEKENIRVTDLVRHALNEFLVAYDKFLEESKKA